MEILTFHLITMSQQIRLVKVLDKGLVTLPKAWRVALNLSAGSMVQAKKVNQSIILEPFLSISPKAKVPYRVYSKQELSQFIASDKL